MSKSLITYRITATVYAVLKIVTKVSVKPGNIIINIEMHRISNQVQYDVLGTSKLTTKVARLVRL